MSTRRTTRIRRFMKWAGLVACLLILVACVVSLKWRILHGGIRHTICLDTAVLAYTDIRGAAEDVQAVRMWPTTGWQVVHTTTQGKVWRALSLPSVTVRDASERRLPESLGIDLRSKWSKVGRRWVYLPLWIPFCIFLVPTSLLFWKDLRYVKPGHCSECGYNLTGNVSGRCPECFTPSLAVERKPLRMRRLLKWCRFLLAAMVFLCSSALCLLVMTPGAPRIIVAFGYDGDVDIGSPLQQNQPTFLSRLLPENQRCNWDGEWLYVNGHCAACWKPLGKPGSFVLAKLPKGLAYAKWDSSVPEHSHLTQPIYISIARLFTATTLLALAIAWGPALFVFFRRILGRKAPCPRHESNPPH